MIHTRLVLPLDLINIVSTVILIKKRNLNAELGADRAVDLELDLGFLSRHELQRLASALATHVEDGRPANSHPMTSPLEQQLPQEVMFEFVQWIKLPSSKIIWVQGVPCLSPTSPLSLAATQVCDISRDLNIPCISFFFKSRYNILSGSTDPSSHKKAACIALLYSVVYQLVHLLPPDFRTDPDGDLGETHFQLLDGSVNSANVALRIIDTLFDHATTSLICVIDGIQSGECPETVPYLRSFVEILRLQQEQRLFKVCFTTQGPSTVLARSVDIRERVDASRLAQARPGNILRGASSISELSSSIMRK